MTRLERIVFGTMCLMLGWMFSRAAVDHWMPYVAGLIFLTGGLIILGIELDRWLNG
jgi:hypothetical protein|tara:strand:+ start:84 stop:251 length:168 start_codon:yes stop_codon:yes gene_type:complete